MKNPFLALLGTTISIALIPTMISVFAYKNVDLEQGNIEPISSITKKNNSEYINYETVNKEVPIIKVYNHRKGTVEKIDLETYLYSVVAGEMSTDFNEEALKAQAVAARTYVMNKIDNGSNKDKKHNGADVCTDYKHCQEYFSEQELIKNKGQDWVDNSWVKIKKAIDDTKGHIVVYDEKPILPLYFSTSSGKTENSEEVFSSAYPYLKSVDSPFDKESPKYISTVKITNKDFVNTIKSSYPSAQLSTEKLDNDIEVIERSEGDSVEKIKIGNKEITGRDVRNLFNLNSSNFELKFNDDYVDILVKGYGHGVGMSQWGANGMADEGYKYYEILKYYYTNTEIKDIY